VRLRSAFVQNRELVMLPREEIIDRVDGCWSLANDQVNKSKNRTPPFFLYFLSTQKKMKLENE
jgi:hypothetical protein